MAKKIMVLAMTVSVILSAIVCESFTSMSPVQAATSRETKATSSLASKSSWNETWDKTVAAARQEGTVMIYTVIGTKTRIELTNAFKEKFGIKLEFVPGRIEETTRKIEEERRAGLYLADVVISATGLFTLLKPKGILDFMEPLLILPEVTDPSLWWNGKVPFMDKDRQIIGMLNQSQRYAVRNTDLTKEGDITSYADFLNPRWKGKIVLRDPTILGASNTWITSLSTLIWGREKTENYLRQLAKQDLAIMRDPRQQVEWVARGKYPIGIGTRMENTAQFMQEKAPLAWVNAAEGGVSHPGSSCVAIVTKRPHPHATAVFINWLLSRDGQTRFIKGYGWPSKRLDVPVTGINPAILPRPGEKFAETNEDAILASKLGLEIGKEIFGPLLK